MKKKIFDNVTNAKRIKLISDIYKSAKGFSNEINLAGVEYIDIEQDVFICDSGGNFQYDNRPRTRCTVKVVASNEKDSQTGIKTLGGSTGYSYWNNVDCEGFGKDVAQTAINMLHASECPYGTYPAVIESGFGGVIFHEACGHPLESDNAVKRYSEFSNKIGVRIAADCVTYIDDGRIRGGWGSSCIDDEGTATQHTVIIKNGILQRYLFDKSGAEKLGQKSTGNGRRQNYTYIPSSRMTNTYIVGGTDDPDSLFKDIKEGLYVKKRWRWISQCNNW
uniref:metallopeptidase TldD-related protein n=1 Tax=Clostridium sp. NkU-1 TaxID=1095009 RepID=UPI0006D130D4